MTYREKAVALKCAATVIFKTLRSKSSNSGNVVGIAPRVSQLSGSCQKETQVGVASCLCLHVTRGALNPSIYNIICWFAGTNDKSTKRLMFQAIYFFKFFIDFTMRKSLLN